MICAFGPLATRIERANKSALGQYLHNTVITGKRPRFNQSHKLTIHDAVTLTCYLNLKYLVTVMGARGGNGLLTPRMPVGLSGEIIVVRLVPPDAFLE